MVSGLSRTALVDRAAIAEGLAVHDLHPPDHLAPDQVEIVGGMSP
jgi:hypothetical protein